MYTDSGARGWRNGESACAPSFPPIYGLGSNLGPDLTYGLSLLLVLAFVPRVFFQARLVSSLPKKQNSSS